MSEKTGTALAILKTIGLGSFIGWNFLLIAIIFIMFTQYVFMDVFFTLWLLVLPLLAVSFMIIAPIFWFVVVPGIARRLTLARFKRGSLQGIATDTGVFDIVQSNIELPAGGILNKFGWWLKPRPTFKSKDKQLNVDAERLILRDYTLADVGKPISLGHLGKMALVNPATLAALAKKPKFDMNPHMQVEAIERFAETLPKHQSKELSSLVKALQEHLDLEPIVWFDTDPIREILPENFTQTQVDDIAYNRELYGRKSAGKDIVKLGVLIIIGAVCLFVVIGGLLLLTGKI